MNTQLPDRFRNRKSFFSGILFLLMIFLQLPLFSQAGYYFGQNKVKYKNFEWSVFRTEHFDVHYYPEIEEAAHDAARMAERGYTYLSKALNYNVKDRIPLILYASHNDFQQTNAISGIIEQGTRGVTEGLKKRVIMPLTGSYREFNHVLVHELVHAFQFDIMFGGKVINNRFSPPLWLVEGMAEYISNDMDNITRMWVRDGLTHDKLLTISELNRTFDIRVYRIGQSVFHFIGETYGKEKVAEIFKLSLRRGSLEVAFKELLGLTEKEFTEKWHAFVKEQVVPADSSMQVAIKSAEKITERHSSFHRMNVVPSVSPDGKHIAYIANKGLNEQISLLSIDENGRLKEKRLINGGGGQQFEALRFFETTIGWSADGRRLAFVSKSGKDDAIYIMNPFSGKILEQFIFDDLQALQSPTFSPDGKQIAFIGIQGGMSDIFILNLEGKNRRRLTHDKLAELHPQWSPDGSKIVFASDRGPDTDLQRLLFSDYDIAVYHLESGNIQLLTNLDGSALNPQWSPDGSEIAFVSDHQGIPNIYKIALAGSDADTVMAAVEQVTAYSNGVSGITNTTPSLSWSASGQMVFSAFDDMAWQLYRMNEDGSAEALSADNQPQQSVDSLITSAEAKRASARPTGSGAFEQQGDWLPQLHDQNALYSEYRLASEDSVEKRDYSKKFKLDGISVGAGYNSFYGIGGGAQFLFSDILGHHNVYASTGLQFNSLLHSDASVTYFNQAKRWNWGVQAFNLSNAYTSFVSFNQVGFIRNTYRGFNGILSYPFSRYARIEATAGVTWVDQDAVVRNFSLFNIDENARDLGLFNYAQAGAALIFDNTRYGAVGPTGGSRSRFEVQTTTNDFSFTNMFADYRAYLNIKNRSVLAWRLMGGASVGDDQQVFRIGGPYYYRGADFDDLLGPKFFVSNLEYRFPMFAFAPPQYDVLSAAVFLDAAGAWGIDAPEFGLSDSFKPFSNSNGFRLQDLNAAVGVGARFNMGYFVLAYDVAWPTDLRSFSKPVNRFSINTFF